jgi:hypothetical protein
MPGFKNPVLSDSPVNFLLGLPANFLLYLPADFLAGFFYEFKAMSKRILNS